MPVESAPSTAYKALYKESRKASAAESIPAFSWARRCKATESTAKVSSSNHDCCIVSMAAIIDFSLKSENKSICFT